MNTDKLQQVTISFENIPTDKADELAGELQERLLRANSKIQLERRRSLPNAQLLGDLLQIPVEPMFDHFLVAIILDFAKEKVVEIVLKVDETIFQVKGTAKEILQKLKDFLQNRKK